MLNTKRIMFIFLLLVFSIGAVSATDLNDNSTTEISYSDVDDGSVLLSNDASNDNVEINQNNGNVLRSIDERNVDSWDELYDCCVEGSDNFILHLNDKEFVADSQITFTLCISEIKFNQPIVADSDRAVIENQWAMTGYDAQNSKNSPYVGLKEVGYVWNYTIGTAPSGNYYASPVIDENGDFYVLGGDKIWAFYKNGNLKWNIQAYNVRGLALDSKGYLIAPVKGNKLVVLNATTGTATGANIFQASSVYEPMIGEDGNIYVAGEYEYDGGFVPIVKYYNSTHYSSDGGYDYSYKSLLDVFSFKFCSYYG